MFFSNKVTNSSSIVACVCKARRSRVSTARDALSSPRCIIMTPISALSLVPITQDRKGQGYAINSY